MAPGAASRLPPPAARPAPVARWERRNQRRPAFPAAAARPRRRPGPAHRGPRRHAAAGSFPDRWHVVAPPAALDDVAPAYQRRPALRRPLFSLPPRVNPFPAGAPPASGRSTDASSQAARPPHAGRPHPRSHAAQPAGTRPVQILARAGSKPTCRRTRSSPSTSIRPMGGVLEASRPSSRAYLSKARPPPDPRRSRAAGGAAPGAVPLRPTATRRCRPGRPRQGHPDVSRHPGATPTIADALRTAGHAPRPSP